MKIYEEFHDKEFITIPDNMKVTRMNIEGSFVLLQGIFKESPKTNDDFWNYEKEIRKNISSFTIDLEGDNNDPKYWDLTIRKTDADDTFDIVSWMIEL